jgi:hypothetical protein
MRSNHRKPFCIVFKDKLIETTKLFNIEQEKQPQNRRQKTKSGRVFKVEKLMTLEKGERQRCPRCNDCCVNVCVSETVPAFRTLQHPTGHWSPTSR